MDRFCLSFMHLSAIIFLALVCGCDEKKMTAPTNFTLIELKPSAGRLTALLQAEAAKAKSLGRKPFVEFYADWCGPCQALQNSLGDPRMIEAFDGTYIIHLDVDAWQGKLSGTGFAPSAIPVFFEINEQGEPTGREIDGNSWEDSTPRNMAPPLKKFFRG